MASLRKDGKLTFIAPLYQVVGALLLVLTVLESIPKNDWNYMCSLFLSIGYLICPTWKFAHEYEILT